MSNPRLRATLNLDSDNARWLGVCAGIARWLDLPTALVRVIFVICVISWPTLLIAYVITYFVLDRGITPDSVQDYFRGADTAEHLRKLNYRKPLYRYPRQGRIAGVCAGIANYLEIKTFWVRLATLGSLFLFGPFTLLGYIVCWVAFDVDPNEPACTGRRAKFGTDESAHSAPESMRPRYDEAQCTEVFRILELRLREIEAYMTSKRFRLHCEINRI
ncbi:MAG: PspC domain-containing protein [Gammaproteobacteria bacterium]|nr:PspC domain-containing protein [Gammaproteobacteria bacterium]